MVVLANLFFGEFHQIQEICSKNNRLRIMRQVGTVLAKKGADGVNHQPNAKESTMSRYRYDDRAGDRDDWDQRFSHAVRGRAGFAWGAFFIGFILGGIIF